MDIRSNRIRLCRMVVNHQTPWEHYYKNNNGKKVILISGMMVAEELRLIHKYCAKIN